MPVKTIEALGSELATKYKGVPFESPQVEALRHLNTLVGLSAKGLYGGGIMAAIMERRRKDDPVYMEASVVVEGAILQCLDTNNTIEAALGICDLLAKIINELNPTFVNPDKT